MIELLVMRLSPGKLCAYDGRRPVQQGSLSYFCDSSFSGDIPMTVMEPCVDVLCHIELSSNCVPGFVSGSSALPNQHVIRDVRGVRFRALR